VRPLAAAEAAGLAEAAAEGAALADAGALAAGAGFEAAGTLDAEGAAVPPQADSSMRNARADAESLVITACIVASLLLLTCLRKADFCLDTKPGKVHSARG